MLSSSGALPWEASSASPATTEAQIFEDQMKHRRRYRGGYSLVPTDSTDLRARRDRRAFLMKDTNLEKCARKPGSTRLSRPLFECGGRHYSRNTFSSLA